MNMPRYGSEPFPKGTRLLLGVVDEQSRRDTLDMLDVLTAWLCAHPSFPLVLTSFQDELLEFDDSQPAVDVAVRWLVL
jgi:hypothetical protein